MEPLNNTILHHISVVGLRGGGVITIKEDALAKLTLLPMVYVIRAKKLACDDDSSSLWHISEQP